MRYQERTVFVSPDAHVTIMGDASLPVEFGREAFGFFKKFGGPGQGMSLPEFLDLFERAVIFETLMRTNGSQKDAARILKLNKSTLNMKVKKQNIRFSRKPL